MKYAVITAKHHEGFCLWDSRSSPTTRRPTPLAAGICSRNGWRRSAPRGLRVGFYYSLLDWHHPHYLVDRNHPQRPATDEEYAALNQGRDPEIYQQYIKDQVRELLTGYGNDRHDLARLFLSLRATRQGPRRLGFGELAAMVRQLQPGIIVNDRLDLLDVPKAAWDFTTPEQYKVSQMAGAGRTTGCPGKPARRSPDRGVITGTKRPGKTSANCWCC